MTNDRFKQTRETIEDINRKIEKLQLEQQTDQVSIRKDYRKYFGNDEGYQESERKEEKQEQPWIDDKQSVRRKPRLRIKHVSEKNSKALNRLRRGKDVRGGRRVGKPNRQIRQLGKGLKQSWNVPISRPFSYEKGMMFQEPLRRYGNNGNCMVLRGVEYVTSLNSNTTANLNPVNSGDMLYMLPIGPMFLPGTELYKEAQCWSKWRFRSMAFHYLPSCPSTTSGSLIGFGQTDVSFSTYGLLSNSDIRIREALARQGAKMFHPFMETKVDLPLPESQSLVWYDTLIDDNAETTIPAQFYIMVETPFTDPNGATNMTLGQILIDYDIEFCSKSLIDVPAPPTGGSITVGTAITTFFTLTAGSQAAFLSNVFSPVVAVNQIIVIIWTRSLLDVTTGNTTINVQSPYNTSATALGQQGELIYGFTFTTNSAVYLTPSLEDALQKNTNRCFSFNNTIVGTDSLTGIFTYSRFDISSVL